MRESSQAVGSWLIKYGFDTGTNLVLVHVIYALYVNCICESIDVLSLYTGDYNLLSSTLNDLST